MIETKPELIFFHNLRFDGNFLIYGLEKRNIEYTIIVDTMNIWYEVEIIIDGIQTKIWDSLKKFPEQSVNDIAKMYNIPQKLEYPDFDRYYPKDYIPTQQEYEYNIRDSKIIAYAIGEEIKEHHRGMTLSTDAFNDVKNTIGGYNGWRKHMPLLSKGYDEFIRPAYKGGWVYVNPKFKDKEIENIQVYDVNSLYPSVMYYCPLPIGKPAVRKPLEGELYIVKFTSEFKLKEGMLPTIQIKGNVEYRETEYISQSKTPLELTLTNIDYDMFHKHYDVEYEIGHIYMSFKSKVGLLKNYIDKWMDIKISASKNNDQAKRFIAKRYLNSPYGKTGMRPDRINKIPYLDEDGFIRFNEEVSETEPIYVPYATFVCAYARQKTISTAQMEYENFVYADTDSVHIVNKDNRKVDIDIDDNKLGAWKLEGVFDKAKYIRAKTYIHADKDYNIQEVKCAGMPNKVKSKITWDNFKIGSEFDGKIMQRRVKGGVMLIETTFKIKGV